MKDAVSQVQIGAQAAARLPAAHREVVVAHAHDGMAGENGVPVGLSGEHQRRAVRGVPAEQLAQVGGLIGHFVGAVLAGERPVGIAHLLQRRGIAARIAQDAGHAVEIVAAVAADASVDVPGDEPHGCSLRRG